MIQVYNIYIYNQKDVDVLINYFKENAHTSQQKKSAETIELYLTNVFEAYQKLDQMVKQNLSERLEAIVILPYEETDNFDEFTFQLDHLDGEEIKHREMLMFESYCDICFGSVPGLYTLGMLE